MVTATPRKYNKSKYKKSKTKKSKFNVAKVFTDRMVKEVQAAIDNGTIVPWHKPWQAAEQMPMAVKTRNTT